MGFYGAPDKILPDKAIVVDGVTTEAGRFNFSRSADQAN